MENYEIIPQAETDQGANVVLVDDKLKFITKLAHPNQDFGPQYWAVNTIHRKFGFGFESTIVVELTHQIKN